MKYSLAFLFAFALTAAQTSDPIYSEENLRELFDGYSVAVTDSCDSYTRIYRHAEDSSQVMTEIIGCRYYNFYGDLGMGGDNYPEFLVRQKSRKISGPFEGEISRIEMDIFAKEKGSLKLFKHFEAECNDLKLMDGGYILAISYGCCADSDNLRVFNLNDDRMILEGDNRIFVVAQDDRKYFITLSYDHTEQTLPGQYYLGALTVSDGKETIGKVGLHTKDSLYTYYFPAGDTYLFELQGLLPVKYFSDHDKGLYYYTSELADKTPGIPGNFRIIISPEAAYEETGKKFSIEFKDGKINGKSWKELDLFFP